MNYFDNPLVDILYEEFERPANFLDFELDQQNLEFWIEIGIMEHFVIG